MPPFDAVDIYDTAVADLDPDGVFAVVCRYASAAVLQWIERHAERLSGVGLFLDDDIPAVVTGRGAELRYRLFLYYRALWPLLRLNDHLDVVWASTPQLASRLRDSRALVLPPAPPQALWRRAPSEIEARGPTCRDVLIAYHATGIHLEEHRFLRPIVEEVLRRRPNASFEVFADRRARPIWRGLGRLRIREPLPWADYVADSEGRRIDVMLVPLAPSHVNDSRASTKRIDVARYGAAAVFSEGPAYGLAEDGDEVRLPYVATAWRDAVLQLIDDRSMRMQLAAATRRAVLQMSSAADTGLDIFKPGYGNA
ncbi:glycosyltransferase family 4 protein [Ensifer aridi]|uniref:glycosyltransferase family 4 protein n=1 Tax=Ensifer aridi TaxID=1708715 RepID=UPI00111C63C8|nr:glycosyltransferase family 4 protein [Ensifer aridi]